MRQSLSPSQDTSDDRTRLSEDTEDREEPVEMSVWGEKSFFRRMASRAPGGWAFTPQPKFRTVDVDVNDEDVENVDPGKVCRLNNLVNVERWGRKLVGFLEKTTEVSNSHRTNSQIRNYGIQEFLQCQMRFI